MLDEPHTELETEPRFVVQGGALAGYGLGVGVTGTLLVRVWEGLHVGPSAFATLGSEMFAGYGLRADYRFRLGSMSVGPWVDAGIVSADSQSFEYGGKHVPAQFAPMAGIHLSYRRAAFMVGIEGGAFSATGTIRDGIYVANPAPDYEERQWYGFGSIVLGAAF